MICFVNCIGGFVNMITPLVISLYLKQILKDEITKIYVYWHVGNQCDCEYDEIFDINNESIVFLSRDKFQEELDKSTSILRLYQIERDRDYKLDQFEIKNAELTTLNIHNYRTLSELLNIIKINQNPNNTDIYISYPELPMYMRFILFNVIQFKPFIKNQVKTFLTSHNYLQHGIHIRGTDCLSGDDEYDIIEKMILVQNGTNEKVFLCTDDEIIHKIALKYPNIVMYPKNDFSSKLEDGKGWSKYIVLNKTKYIFKKPIIIPGINKKELFI